MRRLASDDRRAAKGRAKRNASLLNYFNAGYLWALMARAASRGRPQARGYHGPYSGAFGSDGHLQFVTRTAQRQAQRTGCEPVHGGCDRVRSNSYDRQFLAAQKHLEFCD